MSESDLQHMLRAVFDAALDAMVLTDGEGRYVDVNPAACTLFGLPKEALVGRHTSDFVDPDYVAAQRQQLERMGSLHGEYTLVRPDGTRRDVEFNAVADVLPGLHFAALRDVTERKAAEQTLRTTELRLSTIIANAPLLVFAADKEGIYTLHAGKAVEALGLTAGQLVGQSAIARNEEKPGAVAAIRRALAGEEVSGSFELGDKAFECTILPVRDEGAAVTGIIGVAMDVTSRKSAEAALRASEARFRAMVEKGSEAILVVSAEGKITYASPSTERVLGRSAAEVIGRSPRDLVVPADREQTGNEAAALAADPSRDRTFEARVRQHDGSVRWLQIVSFNMLDHPAVGGLVAHLTDVTERKVAAAVIEESRRLLEVAQAIAHFGSWSAGAGPNHPITWSLECARICGRDVASRPTAAELLDIVHPEDRARVAAASEKAIAEGVPCETEHRIVLPDGRVRWVYARTVLEVPSVCAEASATKEAANGAAAPYRIVGIVQDITERRRVEEARREAELRFRRLFESGLIGVTVTDRAGVVVEANDKFLDMLGYSRADLEVRKLDLAAMTPEPLRASQGIFEELARLGRSGPWEKEYFRKDGSRAPVLIGVATLDETRNVGIAIDETERRRAEERRAAIVSTALDAVVVMDGTGKITAWNPAAERVFGYTSAEVLGRSLAETIIPERYRRAHALGFAHYLATGEGKLVGKRVELAALRRDGTELPVELSITCTGAGDSLSCLGFIRDLSERHRTDEALRRSEERLRQAQKMEAIGNLAGGIAHDFNNLLTVILSYTTMLVEGMEAGDPLRGDLEEVHRAGVRATELTRQLLAFSRQQMLQPVVLDPNRILDGVAKMLGRLLGADIDLSFKPTPLVGQIFADPGQIEQVIVNLAVNARDAMPNGGELTIGTSCVVVEEDSAAAQAGVAAGTHVVLTVSDTGSGMDSATRERIFDPFFTTKDKSKGTGLGLSTVYGIVQQSGGHITVESELGRGSTFKVFLPRTDRPASSEPAGRTASISLHGTETILLVEDEDQVRTILSSVLRRHGYRVLEARNGGEAFLTCEQFKEPIELMITDVVMPRMSGRRLAERLEPLRPDMAVLFVSGYTEDVVLHHGVHEAGINFLQKPILPDALSKKVRQILDSRRHGAPARGPNG